MLPPLEIRPPHLSEAAEIARLHVAAWQETYAGLLPASELHDPTFVSRRTQQWQSIIAAAAPTMHSGGRNHYGPGSPRHLHPLVAVRDHAIVGFAAAGPPPESEARFDVELAMLYTLAAHYGTGVGPALLAAAVPPGPSVMLWVAAENPRALTFYRKHGFEQDSDEVTPSEPDCHGMRALRLVRA